VARTVVLRLIGVAALAGFLLAALTGVSAQTDAGAGMRVVHVGIDTPPVNVSVNGGALVEELLWLEATDYVDVAAGTHEIAIFDPDTSLDDALAAVMLTAEAGNNYSAVITGALPEPGIVLIVDGDAGGIETGMGAVRFFHSVPDAGAVDVATGDGTLLAEGLATMTVSAYVAVAPGTYDIEFREAGTENVLYTEAGVTIAGDAFQTSYLSGLAALTNFAAETFVDEYRGGTAGGAEPTATQAPEPTATEAPTATATPEPAPTATPEPAPTATPVVGMPATGAGGVAADTRSANLMLWGALAVLCLTAGGGLLFRTRRGA
jgi:hypothetical protein